jgi:uncharacterized protein (TIGR02145 family)
MAENLKVTHYNDGIGIPGGNGNNSGWGFYYSGLTCAYENTYGNVATYGRLYNHFVVDKVCPVGWHVPTMSEIGILSSYLGSSPNNSSQTNGGPLKSTGTIELNDGLWYSPNEGATNSFNFNAYPAGIRSYDAPTYQGKGNKTGFWAQDIVAINCSPGGNIVSLHDCGGSWGLAYNHDYLLIGQSAQSTGLSIRCVNNINQVELIELNSEVQEKELIKIIDLMGRETQEDPNTILIYIYSDGTTKRMMKKE